MLRMKRFAWTTIGIWALATLATAQASPSSETYRLQAEDVITIQIYRVDQVNAIVPVGPDGNISAPFVGTIKAAGKTVKELEHDLTIAYAEKLKLKDPIVSVTIREFRAIRAAVSGFVSQPGSYQIRPNDRILDLLARAGGTSTDGQVDLSRAYLVKRDSNERIPIDMEALILYNDSTQNYIVEDGDILVIPPTRQQPVTVGGRVINSGPQPYRQGLRLSEVLTAAREIERRSRMSRVQIFRRLPGPDNRILSITANMVEFHNGKDPRQDIELQPGDFVYVPDSGNLDFRIISDLSSLLFYVDRLNLPIPLLGRRN